MARPTQRPPRRRPPRIRTRRRPLALAVALLTGAALTLTGTSSATAAPRGPLYLNAKAPVDQRVGDLLRRMNLEEKVGQTAQAAVVRIQGDCNWSGGDLTERCMKEVFDDQEIGSILSGGGQPPRVNTPKAWAEMTNAIQKYALEHSRLRIPLIYGVDAVHGHNNVIGATKTPQQIGLGATWDTGLARELGASTSKAVKATGISWNFAPVADISRDTRWGRFYETFAEDPILAGSLADGFVKGSEDSGEVAATVKHFAGYSQPMNGHDRTETHVDLRYLQDTILPAYKRAVDAGADTVMVNSGSLNGVPAHASKYLLTDVLRKDFGFKGVVVSDWDDVRSLQTRFHVVGSYSDAAAKALNAGVDMAMLPPDAVDGYTAGARQAVRDGKVSMRRLDEAAGRVLRLKMKLGLFEDPYVDASKADDAVLGADKELATRAATESMTLLRNDGDVLPLKKDLGKVVVAGPSADSVANQNGGWTIGWQGIPAGTDDPGVTVYEGVKAARGGADTVLAKTADEAVTETQSADAAVVVVGEKPGAEGELDSENPSLAADQQDLIDRLEKTGKPVAVVVLASRPIVLGSAADAKNLLMGWLPGSEAGTAVASVLFGDANPAGRLPVSWPKTVGDQPMSYLQLPGTNGGPSSNYDPLFPFGHGLSYTTYETRGLTLASGSVGRNGTVRAKVTVANTGSRAGTLVVPVYAEKPVSSVLVAPRRLAGFARVDLAAGQQKTVEVAFPISRMAVTQGDVDGSGRPSVSSGDYKVVSGGKEAALTVG